jgi:biopolymer transport protein ExbB
MQRILFLVLLLLSADLLAWWNDAWTGRKAFVLDTSQTGIALSEDLTEVPVLLRLHSGNFPAFFEVADGGRDFRFFAEDEVTPLKYHIESFDPINELAFVWVKIPLLAANAAEQKIWMYYGNPTAPAAADIPGTFDVAQTLAVHFDPDLNLPTDATAYANNPVTVGSVSIPNALAGAGGRLDGTSGIVFPPSPTLRLDPQSGWTLSAWFKPGNNDGIRQVMRIGEGPGALSLRLADGQLEVVADAAGDSEPGETMPLLQAPGLSMTGWQQIALVVDAAGVALYNNGQAVARADIPLTAIDGPLVIGGSDDVPGYIGDIDEIRVANVARSSQWVYTAFETEGGDKLVSAVDAETQSGGDGGGPATFFGTILSNVSVDGWVVIGLLGIMSALSWVVMVMKTMSLNRIAADNRQFMEQFRTLDPEHPDALDMSDDDDDEATLAQSPILQSLFGRHDHFQSSNVYHVYHVGMTELHRRIGSTVGAQANLSQRGLSAIRSAMDAATVRETQKLNSLMVMLTIAISGGPFLGLLGTVMGVMITFAAIAISGDVNIDAIAPGVSAALMTTVAGLFVAIPALFGYNYLALRIRDMTADMYVFVDELEARIGEHHA